MWKFVTMTSTKISKSNPKAKFFSISLLSSDISGIIKNYEKTCPPLVQNNIIAKKNRDICE